MLQPRLVGCASEMGGKRNCVWSLVLIAVFLTAVTCQDVNDDHQSIEATRIKREGVPENRDLTVLLVNDQKRNDFSRSGRYHSVKPLIGLLTSTARTFIQDGVTTEYATQILGTTLDNGRIYAQLLTKSSLVLYNKPSNVDDPVIVKPTRIHSDFDGQWNVKQDLGFIDPDKFVLKNTDYLAPSKMDIIYASKPTQDSIKYWSPPTSPDNHVENQVFDEPTARRIQPVKEIPRYIHNEALNFLDGPIIDNERKFEFIVQPSILDNVNTLHRQSKAYEPVTDPIKSDTNVNEEPIVESNVVKVKPDYDLPTFTIKNEFSPIFYYIDNVESKSSYQQTSQQTKQPKKLFGQKSEPRTKTTFTYNGFADFTTVVGDTVIIFSPNTDISRPQDPNEVNVFPSAKPISKSSPKITYLAADIPAASSIFNAHEINSATQLATPDLPNSSEQPIYDDDESFKKGQYEVDNTPDRIAIKHDSGFDFNLDVIQPSESIIPTTENTRYTDDLGVIPIQDYTSKPTEPLKPSATIDETSKESAVTENILSELFTNSEEESENTAAEVTEKTEEEEEEEEEEETTTEMSDEVFTTTESGHSEESFEDIETTPETTTETKHDSYEDKDITCTNGLETQFTMTTAYKTLTYLTTYFIPLESSVTTTSIKSDVIVESDIGYLTNIVCNNNLNIEPTAVISIEVQSSVHSNLEIPQTISEEAITSSSEVVTEEPSNTSKAVPEIVKTSEQEDETQETGSDTVESEEKEPSTTTTTTTTTEQTTTTQSHVEVSVSTEHSTTSTEKPVSEEPEEIPTEENEIDLIYKTLYTTYTYFTTFFGDQTSSVASHKSVITNIITSTLDLSKLDPSLLGAFNENEIRPTSVGIGRPTESFAINSIIDLVKNKDVIESVEVDDIYASQTPTPSLGDDIGSTIKPDAVKTYFTTYTFFTTIYVGSDANVCSRNEVYTNYVGPDELIPTKSNPLAVENTRAQFDFRNCKQIKIAPPASPEEENYSMESSVSMEENDDELAEETKKETPQPSPIEVDMLFSVESNPLESENLYVTDVKSSSSRGERQLLDNNNLLEDQISSESNIDEIMPSPTLILQTSYTTFTYFTTMYIGKDSSKVKSHLETITNVVTGTIMPNSKKEPEEESNLPITYYTTFTYWTTLYKDKSTTTTSREEIVSNVVIPTPSVQVVPTVSPIDTTPIEVESVLPPNEIEVQLKPSLVNDNLEQEDGKATFYTTYTYFTTFYAGNTSEIRSSLETVTNIVDNTKVVEDNQLGRKVPSGAADKNLIQDNGNKPKIVPTVVKEEIKTTKLPDIASASHTVLLGTYIDNLFAEVKPADGNAKAAEPEKKILFSQVAVISGDSTIVTSDNKTLVTEATTNSVTTNSVTTEGSIISASPDVIEGSVGEPEVTTEAKAEVEEEDSSNTRKKSRLSFTPKKPTFTPVIIPFASRNRPTFSPKRVPILSGATTITRLDVTPTITATPTLKSVRPSGFGANRKQSATPGSSSSGRRFSGNRSSASNLSSNIPTASRSGGFARGSIQPTSRRTGYRSSSQRSNSLDYASRSAVPRIRPTASSRLRNNRQSSSVSFSNPDQNESETLATQQEENATEPLEEASEAPARTTNNPLLRFRRPPLNRQPGTAVTPRSTTPSARRNNTPRGRLTTTTTRRTTTRTPTNPLLSLRRQRPNALFPRRNLFNKPEPEPEEEIKENEQKVEESEEILEEEEDFEVDNDYDSSDRKEQQVATPSTAAPRKPIVSIRPFAFKRRSKRQVDYGSRKYSNFRRPGTKVTTRRPDPEPETEPPAPSTHKVRPGNRYNSRTSSNSRSTTVSVPKVSSRQPFIIRGESRTTTTSSPAYRRAKSSRPTSRSTTSSSRPKAPRLSNRNASSDRSRSSSSRTTSRSRARTTTSRANSRQRSSFENTSGERFRDNHILNDGRITVTYQIPTEVTIPVVNGKITEYKNLLSATPSVQTLLRNQVSTSIGPLGNQQLVLVQESTEIGDNGATKLIKYVLHETPTTTVLFTPTTIRGRKTSYSHILPSTIYNVEAQTQTIAPEISANVPLANLLLSQLLLGNQQPAINPLLALQGQALLPQQQVAQTPVTEYKTRTTSYVTTITDARETVLPITFKGKAILTTIVDPTTSVVTATEFITDTIVTTPTALAQSPNQLNSLLLPLLLQQQQQQQQALSLQTSNPLLGLGQADLSLLQNNNLNFNNDIYSNSPKPNILSDLNSNEDFSEEIQDSEEDLPPPPPPPPRARKSRPQHKPTPASPPKQTSVVTLYVSGRHPGEFSTVLSTVVSEETQTVRKREAIYYENIKILPSILPSVDEIFSSQADIENSIIPNSEKYFSVTNESEGTQSLESIVGEISKHIRYDASPTYVIKLATTSKVTDTRQNSLDGVS